MSLPRFAQVPCLRGLEPALSVAEGSRLFAGGSPSAMGELGAPIPDLLPFGPSLSALLRLFSTFGLSSITTFISGSRMLTMPRDPGP